MGFIDRSILKMTATKQVENLSNFRVRVLSALIAGPIVLVVVFQGGWLFTVLALVVAVVAVLEFDAMGKGRGMAGSAVISVPIVVAMILAFNEGQYMLLPIFFVLAVTMTFILEMIRHTDSQHRWYRVLTTFGGLVYVGLPSAFLVGIRSLPNGLIWLLAVLALTWGTDTFAYLGGRLWGKTPLAPTISPKKTVEGAVVGLLGGFIPALLILAAAGLLSVASLILLVLGPPVAIMGDLFESRLKRFFDVGDSHIAGLNIIPGHGGVLDRTDALLWVVSLCYVYIRLTGIAG
jgi:phosphatidate cytidylyltransferase